MRAIGDGIPSRERPSSWMWPEGPQYLSPGHRPGKAGRNPVCRPERAQQRHLIVPFQGVGSGLASTPREMPWAKIFQPFRLNRGPTNFLTVLILLLGAGVARAESALPRPLREVGFDQRLNEQVPLDLAFRDEAGRPVHLGDYFDGKPVILVLA